MYFRSACTGKRGRSGSSKVPDFGLLKRNGKVYAFIILMLKDRLIPIIREKEKPDSSVYNGLFKSYNALYVSEFANYSINQSKIVVYVKNHISGIESFWNQAKRHSSEFDGVPKQHFLPQFTGV